MYLIISPLQVFVTSGWGLDLCPAWLLIQGSPCCPASAEAQWDLGIVLQFKQSEDLNPFLCSPEPKYFTLPYAGDSPKSQGHGALSALCDSRFCPGGVWPAKKDSNPCTPHGKTHSTRGFLRVRTTESHMVQWKEPRCGVRLI